MDMTAFRPSAIGRILRRGLLATVVAASVMPLYLAGSEAAGEYLHGNDVGSGFQFGALLGAFADGGAFFPDSGAGFLTVGVLLFAMLVGASLAMRLGRLRDARLAWTIGLGVPMVALIAGMLMPDRSPGLKLF